MRTLRFGPRFAAWCTLCTVLLASAGVEAQFVAPRTLDLAPANLPVVGQQIAGDFAQARELIANRHWEEAVAVLRRLMETPQEGVVSVAASGVAANEGPRFVSVLHEARMQLATLPAEGLAIYRRQVDPLAEAWYGQAQQTRDPELLERIVAEMFCSSWGDEALLMLGDIAIEAGQYEVARRHLERLAPQFRGPGGRPLWIAFRDVDFDHHEAEILETHLTRSGPTQWLAYPDTNLPLADVLARLALVSIRELHLARARVEVTVLRHWFPGAQGRLGGRQIDLAAVLDEQIEAARSWPTPEFGSDWPTFGGASQRTRVTGGEIEVQGSLWSHPIEIRDQGPNLTTGMVYGLQSRESTTVRPSPGFHPVVAGDLLLYSDRDQVFAHRLDTADPAFGDEAVVFRPRQQLPNPHRKTQELRVGIPRYTLTVHNDLLLAHVGDPRQADDPRTSKASGELLVGLDLSREAALRFSIAPEDRRWAFEGAPVCDGDYLYVAMRRFDVGSQAHVACYDLQTRTRQWMTKVCSAGEALPVGRQPVCNNLLTLSGDTIFYNTNLGAVAAIAAGNGQINWLSRYDRSIGGTLAASRIDGDVNPCIATHGLVFAAPHDSTFIYAFDATTGLLHWKTDLPRDASQLLGVVGNNLVATGDRVWLIDIRSGAAVTWPWPEGNTAIRSGGRGAILGTHVYWPTRQGELLVFDAAIDRESERELRPLQRIDLKQMGIPPGNVVIAGTTITIASGRQIHAIGNQMVAKQERDDRAAAKQPASGPPGEQSGLLGQHDRRRKISDE